MANAEPQLIARMILNGANGIIFLWITGMCIYRLAYEVSHGELLEAQRRPIVRVALALGIVFMGECVRSLWVFLTLNREILGAPAEWLRAYYPLPLGLAALTSLGGLYVIRMLSPRGTGRLAVLATLVSVGMFLGACLLPGGLLSR